MKKTAYIFALVLAFAGGAFIKHTHDQQERERLFNACVEKKTGLREHRCAECRYILHTNLPKFAK